MPTRIQLRRDSSTSWTTNNPILAQGEIGIEIDTLKQKIGDGITAWNSLGYSAQKPTDNSLNTTSKTIVGAINEHESDLIALDGRVDTLENQIVDENRVKIYDTVQQMIDDSANISVGMTVQLLGYYTKNDGAGHYRKIESTDDGSGIDLGGLWANIIPAFNGEVCVKWFGAKGDGVQEEKDILQKCFDYSNKVFLNEGIYKCNGTLYQNNGELRGIKGFSILDFNNGNYRGLTNKLTATKNIKVTGITVKNVVGFGFGYSGVNLNNMIENIEITDCFCENISLCGFFTTWANNVIVSKNTAINCRDNGIYLEFSRNTIINSNIIEDCGGSGGIVVGYSSGFSNIGKFSNSIISNNIIKYEGKVSNNLISGIDVVFATNVLIEGNLITDGKSGILFEEHILEKISIKNNLISNTQTTAEYGIRGDLVNSSTVRIRDIDIKNNSIYGYTKGVYLANCYSIDISNNKISSSRNTLMEIIRCSDVSIDNNHFIHDNAQSVFCGSSISCINSNNARILNNQINGGTIGGRCYRNTGNGQIKINNVKILELYLDSTLESTIDLSNKNLSQIKTLIESVPNWFFEFEEYNTTLIPKTIRRTGQPGGNDVSFESAITSDKAWIGETEGGHFVNLNNVNGYKLKNNYYLKESSLVGTQSYENFVNSFELPSDTASTPLGETLRQQSFSENVTTGTIDLLKIDLVYNRSCVLRVTGQDYTGFRKGYVKEWIINNVEGTSVLITEVTNVEVGNGTLNMTLDAVGESAILRLGIGNHSVIHTVQITGAATVRATFYK